MELLPNLNNVFKNAWRSRINIARLNGAPKPNDMQILVNMFNTELNSLDFREIEAWFDKKVSKADNFKFEGYERIEGDTYMVYNVYYCMGGFSVNFYLSPTGYLRSRATPSKKFDYKDILDDNGGGERLATLTGSTNLQLFCEMKGYVEL